MQLKGEYMSEEMDRILTISGIVKAIIFFNNDNFYTVFALITENDSGIEELTCVGHIPDLVEGESVTLQGEFFRSLKHGMQFRVNKCVKNLPKTEDAIKIYLLAMQIRGVGKKRIDKIIQKFGKDIFDILEKAPEKLAEVKGITLNTAKKIAEEFEARLALQKVIEELAKYGISEVFAIKLFNYYNKDVLDIIKENPYELLKENFGIPFKIIDNIALRNNFPKINKDRIGTAIDFILNETATKNGNVYLPQAILIEKVHKLLNIEKEFIENELIDLQMCRQIYILKKEDEEDNFIFLNYYFYLESYVAKKIAQLSFDKIDTKININKLIKKFEKDKNMELASAQKKAIEQAIKNRFLIITGGPGTGKTTIIKAIINILLENDLAKEVKLCASTGRAAKRMADATGYEAKTIHRLLGLTYIGTGTKPAFDFNINLIDADLVIVDECSMIDIILMNNLLMAIKEDTRLILVGDANQLPAVGPGNVLKDMIASECIKTIKLDKIFRQKKESAIITNAHRINSGQYPILSENNKDFFFLKRNSREVIIKTIIDLITKRLPTFLKIKNIEEIQVICPMKNSILGVKELNIALQDAINPPDINKKEKIFRNIVFREGDKVMQTRNNYDLTCAVFENGEMREGDGVFNGEIGVITSIDDEGLIVAFEEYKKAFYTFSDLNELELSYATTIHKAQGSEYRAIILPLYASSDFLLNRNLLYTAVTRAKELVVIIGLENLLYFMVDNNNEAKRYTYLKDKIITAYQFVYDNKSKNL